MADMILMKCEYCGGTLVNVQGNQWFCQNCGTSAIVNTAPAENAAASKRDNGFSMTVEYSGRTSNYKVRENAEFQIAFDRRATMADPFPTTVSLSVDGRPRGTFEHLPKSGTGTVTFEVDEESVVAYATGKASFSGPQGNVVSDDDVGGAYTVAGLKITIERTGEMKHE